MKPRANNPRTILHIECIMTTRKPLIGVFLVLVVGITLAATIQPLKKHVGTELSAPQGSDNRKGFEAGDSFVCPARKDQALSPSMHSGLPTSSPPAPSSHFAVLLLSFFVWIMALSAAHHSHLLLSQTRAQPSTALVYSRSLLRLVFSLFILMVWLGRTLLLLGWPPDHSPEEAVLICYPIDFAPGFLIASLPLVVFASLRIALHLTSQRTPPDVTPASPRNALNLVVHLIFNILTGAASIVTLWAVFKR